MRIALAILIALVVFVSVNVIAVQALLRIHPTRRRWIITASVFGNLMWPFIALLQQSGWFMRITRAVLGPRWFSWQSFAILYSALTIVVALAWLLSGRRTTFGRFGRWPSRIFLTAGLLGTIAGIYHALVPIRIENVPIELAGLPKEADGTRIVLLADLHVGLFTRPSRLDTIFATARALEPDIVLILGDLIDDDPWFTPKLLAGTRALGPGIPLYAVIGNHEIYGNPLRVIEQAGE